MNSDIAVRSSGFRLRSALLRLQGPLLVALLYYLGAEAAFAIGTLSDRIFALFWPPNVILFCALLIVPVRDWWLYLPAAFVAHTVAELGVGMPVQQLLVAFATNCMVALLSALLVRRFVGDPPWFGNFHKAATYILIAAGFSPAVSALGGAFVPILGGGSFDDYWLYWSHWYLANVLPNLSLGPFFMIWFSDRRRWVRWLPSRRQIEPVLHALLLVATCILVVWLAGRLTESKFLPAVLLLPLAPVLLAAIRYGEKGASGAILVVTVILTWRTLNGPSLFATDAADREVLVLQLFLMGLAIPILLLGAVIDDLRRAAQTTRRLAASLVRAQDDERRRIARDLHDSTGQNLIAATLIAGRLHPMLPASAQENLNQLEDMLQRSIREVRTVSYVLHPPLLDEGGLEIALKYFVEGFRERTAIDVEVNIAPRVPRLNADTELVLFRVVQEALANVNRHSGSATAKISLSVGHVYHRRSVVLAIEDAGRGMPQQRGLRGLIGAHRPPAWTQSVGLSSMQERLEQVHGSLDIKSAPGRTVVTAVVPMGAAAER
jgi:signal transduction histidine kinase